MAELFLTYTEDSEPRRVKAEGERFSVGRHSDNDLVIRDSRLSRYHLRIERFADVFVASDIGSSNGTKLNGEELTDPISLSDGDELDLGGFLISVEFDSGDKGGGSDDKQAKAPPEAKPATPAARPAAPEPQSQPLGKLFIIAPIAALLLLIFVGGGIVIYSLVKGGEDKVDDRFPTPYEDLSYATPEDTGSDTPETTDPTGTPIDGTAGTPVPSGSPTGEVSDDERLRNLVTEFMRGIAHRDPSPVITSEPLSLIKTRVDRFRGNPAVASNIENAVKSKDRIEALARTKNLRPEFVAGAALAKLGGSRGDVAATAAGMIDILSQLKIQIGDAFANECVLIIAAYDQGERGQFLEMRDLVTKLSTDNPNTSSRKIRTVWYLKEQGKLSDAQFEFAVRFLALGAIAEDPSAFGVSAPPLRFG